MKKYISKELFETLKTKKAFIFDFDGTLASTYELLFQTLKKLYSIYGYSYSRKEYDKIVNQPSSKFIEQFQECVKEPVSAGVVNQQYLDIFNELANTQKLTLYEYVEEIVKAFPNKIYCVASNNIQDFLNQRISEFGLSELFKNIYACGGESINKKFVYQNTQKLFGVKPQDCVLFEDAQKYIDEAHELGITTVGIIHNGKDLVADHYIDLKNE